MLIVMNLSNVWADLPVFLINCTNCKSSFLFNDDSFAHWLTVHLLNECVRATLNCDVWFVRPTQSEVRKCDGTKRHFIRKTGHPRIQRLQGLGFIGVISTLLNKFSVRLQYSMHGRMAGQSKWLDTKMLDRVIIKPFFGIKSSWTHWFFFQKLDLKIRVKFSDVNTVFKA